MSAKRNLLLGMLALQNNFIDRAQLLAAFNGWVEHKSKSLGDLLVAQQALSAEHRALLEALTAAHLQQHGDDADRSLAALSSAGSARRHLAKIADADVQESLASLAVGQAALPVPVDDADPHATVSAADYSGASGRFIILRPHASGGLGTVSVALDQELHRQVALKEIKEKHVHSADARSRFLLEAEITGGLEHPGIVPVYSLGTYGDGRPYYAMRFIKGDSLKQAIDHFHRTNPEFHSLDFRNLLGRFVDVCNAISYAHSRGVLHRDLKPGNIMLGKYGETLVVDWGLAKAGGTRPSAAGSQGEPSRVSDRVADEESSLRPASGSIGSDTLPGSALGTPSYMSPEQAAGRLDQLGPPADVYSLGATLYHLLTGQAPFTGKDTAEILRQVQAGEFTPPRQVQPAVPPALEAICLKAMALRPMERYSSTRELAEEVERWLADEPVKAWPEPWRLRGLRWAKRRPVLSLWIVVSAVVYISIFASGLAALFLARGTDVLPALGGLLICILALAMSLGAHLAALAGAGIGRALDWITSRIPDHKPAGEGGAATGARIGLIVGAGLGYLGVMAHFLVNWPSAPGGTASFLSAVLLTPVLCAGLGVLIGAWKSRKLRGGVLGGLAGVPLAVILTVVLIGVSADSRFGHPETHRLRAYDELVRALLRLEKHADAVRAAQEYAAAFPNEPGVAYDNARFIARSVPIAEKDSTLGPRERAVIAQEYGRLAVQHLRQATQLGYHDAHQMKTEPDLDPLRDRQDFRELLAE